MNEGAAFVAIVVAFAVGWLMHNWRGAENNLRLARARADDAGRAVWRARRQFAGVVILVLVLVYLWLH